MSELDEGSVPANPETVKDDRPVEEPSNNEQPEELKFSKLQMEQLATLVGRISKKQLEENVIPLISRREEPINSMEQQNETIKEFNDKLQQKIFDGDVLGAIQMATDVQNRAKDTLTKTQIREVEKNIVSYSDKPFYKDIYSDMDKIAKDAIIQGVPPEWAVEHAYHKALADYLSGNRINNNDDGSLDMVTGGKQYKRSGKEPKLPEDFKNACARDIASGLFKNEKEWIDNLSPKVRGQLGI